MYFSKKALQKYGTIIINVHLLNQIILMEIEISIFVTEGN